MNLKPGIDVSDVMDGDKLNLLVCPDLLKNLIKLSALLTSTDKGTCGIKSESIPFEGDHITSHLFLFFKEKGLQPSLRKKGGSSQPSYPRPNHDGIVSFTAHGASAPTELKGLEESKGQPSGRNPFPGWSSIPWWKGPDIEP